MQEHIAYYLCRYIISNISFGFLILVEHTTCVHLVFIPLVLDGLLRNNNNMHKLSLCVRMQEQIQPRVK
jgi:hypothetical protein